ncbi:MAG: hypothetical protein K0M78_13030 [Brevundimonas sp.]|nr:hypothetical protein [Brevundimonas sp.]
MDWRIVGIAAVFGAVAVLIAVDLWTALRLKAFRRGQGGQLFTVRVASRPKTYWFLVVAHISIIAGLLWLTGLMVQKVLGSIA